MCFIHIYIKASSRRKFLVIWMNVSHDEFDTIDLSNISHSFGQQGNSRVENARYSHYIQVYRHLYKKDSARAVGTSEAESMSINRTERVRRSLLCTSRYLLLLSPREVPLQGFFFFLSGFCLPFVRSPTTSRVFFFFILINICPEMGHHPFYQRHFHSIYVYMIIHSVYLILIF